MGTVPPNTGLWKEHKPESREYAGSRYSCRGLGRVWEWAEHQLWKQG